MRLLLDTNAYVGMRRGDERVSSLLRDAEEILISTVVLGELEYGFFNGRRYAANKRSLGAFLATPFVSVIGVGAETSNRYGRIAAQLRRAGTPIPTNDVWIAAHGLETGANVVSFDRHFGFVDGLAWIDPATDS